MGFKTAVLNDVRVNAVDAGDRQGRARRRRPRRDRRRDRRRRDHPDDVGGGHLDDRRQSDSEAADRQPQRAGVRRAPAGRQTPGGPGGSRDSTVNGLPQSAINITIDGMSAQDNHLKTGDGFFARVSPRLDAIEEVTVNSAAQDAASTGQGAVQIRFVTRSGSNQFTGSGYYYLQHYKLNANTWFNNRDNAPKADDVLHQPGGAIRRPDHHPGTVERPEQGVLLRQLRGVPLAGQATPRTGRSCTRARSRGGSATPPSGQTREVNVLALAAARLELDASIRRSPGCSAISGAPRPAARWSITPIRSRSTLTYSYNTDSVTKYPTGRVDVQCHRQAPAVLVDDYTDLVSTPDTTNNREPQLPGLPEHGQPGLRSLHHARHPQIDARRKSCQRVHGRRLRRGDACSRPRSAASQFSGTSVADQAGFLLNINAAGGITNAASTGSYSGARGFDEGHREHAELAARLAQHPGGRRMDPHRRVAAESAVRADDELRRRWRRPGRRSVQHHKFPRRVQRAADRSPRPVRRAHRPRRLDQRRAAPRREHRPVRVPRPRPAARPAASTTASSSPTPGAWKPNFTVNLGLRYDLQLPFYPRNNSYSKATVADVWGQSGSRQPLQPGGLTGTARRPSASTTRARARTTRT